MKTKKELLAAWQRLREEANKSLKEAKNYAEFLEEIRDDCDDVVKIMRAEGAIE